MTITSSVPPVSSAKSLSQASSSEHSGSSMEGGTITTVAILFSSCGMRGEQASEIADMTSQGLPEYNSLWQLCYMDSFEKRKKCI